MALPGNLVPDAKGRAGASYWAGVADVFDQYGRAQQVANAQGGALAVQSIGALAQTVMAGFDSYRQYQLGQQEIQYKRDRDIIADNQWRMNYERQLKMDEISLAHDKLEDEKLTLELVKLRRAQELEAPTMMAKMDFAARAQDIRSVLSELRSNNVIDEDKLRAARAAAANTRSALRAQAYQNPGMNLGEEIAQLDELDKYISDAGTIALGDEKVSIASVPSLLAIPPTNAADVRQLYDLARSKEVSSAIREQASKRLSALRDMDQAGWSEYAGLSDPHKRELAAYAMLAMDPSKQRLADSARERGDTRSLYDILTGKTTSTPVGAASGLPESAQKTLNQYASRPISYQSKGLDGLERMVYHDKALTPSEYARAVTEINPMVGTDEIFDPSTSSQSMRAHTSDPLWRLTHKGADPVTVDKRAQEFVYRKVAEASTSYNPLVQEAALREIQEFLSTPELVTAARGTSKGPSAPVFTGLFAVPSSPFTLALNSLARSPDSKISALAADLLRSYSPALPPPPSELTLGTRPALVRTPLVDRPPSPVAGAFPGQAPNTR